MKICQSWRDGMRKVKDCGICGRPRYSGYYITVAHPLPVGKFPPGRTPVCSRCMSEFYRMKHEHLAFIESMKNEPTRAIVKHRHKGRWIFEAHGRKIEAAYDRTRHEWHIREFNGPIQSASLVPLKLFKNVETVVSELLEVREK